MKNQNNEDSLSMTLDTKTNDNTDNNYNNFENFGLCEKSTQTDMTGRDVDLVISGTCLINLEKLLNENNENHKINSPKKSKINQKEKNNNNQDKKDENNLLHKRKREDNHNQNLSVKDIVNNIISDSVNKSEVGKKIVKKKIDAYMLFKGEYYQMHKEDNEEDLEKNCKNAWNELSKDFKKYYNMNAENENKRLKKELKQQRKNEKNNN